MSIKASARLLTTISEWLSHPSSVEDHSKYWYGSWDDKDKPRNFLERDKNRIAEQLLEIAKQIASHKPRRTRMKPRPKRRK